MSAPQLALDQAQDAVDRVNAKLRDGYKPKGLAGAGESAVEAAAIEAIRDGVTKSRAAMNSRLLIAKERFNLEPDWGLYSPQRYHMPTPKSVLFPAPPANSPEPSAGERVLVIGDLHQDPRHPDRMDILTWMARYASDQRFGRIIQIGDWSTNDSVSKYDRNETYKAKFKPQIRDDLANLKGSLAAFQAGKDEDYRPRLTMLYGNHDERLETYENNNPETYGAFTGERDEAFLQYGWQTRRYGQLYYCQGVAFGHHPVNGGGRAFGGETGPQRAANKTTVSFVSGHTHRAQRFDAAKIGPQETVSMIEVGCAMPWGSLEAYVGSAPAGWWWGAVDMVVADGLVVDCNFVSMKTIRSRYSGDGADIKAA
jgi:hypothetical protein